MMKSKNLFLFLLFLLHTSVQAQEDKTSLIVNPSFENSFTGWVNNGFAIQTNAVFTPKDGVNFIEKWVNRGSKVPDVSIEQTITGLDNGKYRLTAACGNIQQTGAGSNQNLGNPQTGAYLFSGYNRVSVDTMKERSVDFIVFDGQGTIGLKTENATGNWVTADNFRLTFLGNYAVEDYVAYLQHLIEDAQDILPKKMRNAAKTDLQAAINQAQQAVAENPASTENLNAAGTAIRTAINTANASILSYQSLQQAVEYGNQVLQWYSEDPEKIASLQSAVNTANTALNNLDLTTDAITASTNNVLTLAQNIDKKIHYPYWIWDGAANAYITQTAESYSNPASRFSSTRMKHSKNFIVLWEAGFGDDPETAAAGYRVPLTDVLENLENMYAFYRDSLKFVYKGQSLTDQYKMVVYLFYNSTFGTAYGSGADGKVGVMLLYPSRIQYGPYGVLAHELGHAFQYMVGVDGKWGYSGVGTAWEMTSQFMLWQYYINWSSFEAYHINAFLGQTHLAFTHPDNQYHSPFVLEYWNGKHGKTFIADLWRAAVSEDDFSMTYKRMNNLSQKGYNDEMFDACRRFITWDMDRVRASMAPFANKHTCSFTDSEGWKKVAVANAPQNYGYNGIRLNVPTASNRTITVDFEGITDDAGYTILNPEMYGWRYGFVAHKSDGTREYSEVRSESAGSFLYDVPANTQYLWLVVMAAPTQHWKYSSSTAAQIPYKIKLYNTNLYGQANNPPSSIENIPYNPEKGDDRIYGLDGQYIGTGSPDSLKLKPGIYIQNRKKIIMTR